MTQQLQPQRCGWSSGHHGICGHSFCRRQKPTPTLRLELRAPRHSRTRPCRREKPTATLQLGESTTAFCGQVLASERPTATLQLVCAAANCNVGVGVGKPTATLGLELGSQLQRCGWSWEANCNVGVGVREPTAT